MLGPIHITYYALIILTAIAVAIWLTSWRLKRRGGPSGVVLDIAIWAVPFGIVGGRLYHVVTHPGDYFFPGADLTKIFFVWEGGLAIFGAAIFGALGAYIGCRRAGIRFLSFADALAPALLIAQGIGRIGCYFAEELFGAPTTLPWGLEVSPTNPAFPAGLPADTLFHPLFLYELIWNFIGAGVIFAAERRFHLRWGKAIGLYLVWYGIGRTWLEDLRLDPTEFLLGGVKINMVTAMTVALLGVVFIIVQSRRRLGPETSVYLPGRDPDAAAPSAEARTPDVHSDVDDDLVSASPSTDGRSDLRQPPGA
ncbi:MULTISPECIES: prolipoprotein diacylglyceryl transferase [Bacteria]